MTSEDQPKLDSAIQKRPESFCEARTGLLPLLQGRALQRALEAMKATYFGELNPKP